MYPLSDMRVTLRRLEAAGLVFLAGGCDPILNIQGSFFPAWMVCLVVGVALAFVLRYVFAITRLEPHLGPPRTDLSEPRPPAHPRHLARLVSDVSAVDEAPRPHLPLRVLGRLLGVLIVLGAVVLSVYVYQLNFVHPRTDDAAVRANVVGIAPHVGGPLVELKVVDNQRVKQGDLLFVIDPRPYEARLARARADLSLALKDVEAQQKAIASAGCAGGGARGGHGRRHRRGGAERDRTAGRRG